MISVVLGGARSGKSRYAESLVKESANSRGKNLSTAHVFYVATATAGDDEMTCRIERHQADRPAHWQLIEEPLYLADVVTQACDHDILLIDCMTLYLTNWLCEKSEDNESLIAGWRAERASLLDALKITSAQIVIVSNEVGSGIIPLGELSRVFVDEAGWLNQTLAELADDVTLVVAGCPMSLKQGGAQKSGAQKSGAQTSRAQQREQKKQDRND
jgi:adenosylcobinamide kinase/adenosylcobinamide-phosphate guanylyltransferase